MWAYVVRELVPQRQTCKEQHPSHYYRVHQLHAHPISFTLYILHCCNYNTRITSIVEGSSSRISEFFYHLYLSKKIMQTHSSQHIFFIAVEMSGHRTHDIDVVLCRWVRALYTSILPIDAIGLSAKATTTHQLIQSFSSICRCVFVNSAVHVRVN